MEIAQPGCFAQDAWEVSVTTSPCAGEVDTIAMWKTATRNTRSQSVRTYLCEGKKMTGIMLLVLHAHQRMSGVIFQQRRERLLGTAPVKL